MARLTTFIRKVSAAITGAQFAGLVTGGVKVSNLLQTLTAVNGGFKVNTLAVLITMPLQPGTAVSTFSSGTVTAGTNPAPKVSSLLDNTGTVVDKPAAEVVQITYNLTGTYGATGTGGSGFTNPANATGPKNGTTATHAGSATATSSATLQLTYPSFPNKTDLVITNVTAKLYYSQAGTTLANGVLAYTVRKGGVAGTVLQSGNETGNVDFTTTPKTFDLTASFTTWADLATFAAVFTHNTPALNTCSCAIDAVELVVTASHTQIQ